ncbi:MAG TPA: choice-of-anchor tandem repeat GloVer-containing protein [Bradyrhizobium sp.]|nr:choice-of-anchor tandem repeat GloVer-containing protein [Bradyrhizobium sp.]
MIGSRLALVSLITASALFVPLAANCQTLTTLHAFGGSGDGSKPGVLLSADGKLYGTTSAGGAFGLGTLFEITAGGTENVLHSFAGADGANPLAGVVKFGSFLIGTTVLGGPNPCAGSGCGTIFTFSQQAGETVSYAFQGNSDGKLPESTLLANGSSVLYGTTALGGGNGCGGGGCGTVFKFTPGSSVVMYRFAGQNDGQTPAAGLILVGNNLYGTTVGGGPSGLGTVFSLNLATITETVVHAFAGSDGARPVSALTYVGGKLFGTTSAGGASGDGTVFSIDPVSGAETVLHSFGGNDGESPLSSLVQVQGQLYGSTEGGGTKGFGTLFRIDAGTGNFQTVYNFSGGADGANPATPMINIGGILYGSTTHGGSSSDGGTVFQFQP